MMRACSPASRRHGVRHHEEAHGLEPDLAGQAEVLVRDVGLCAVGGDPDDRDADVADRLDVVLRAQPRQHQRRDLGGARLVDRGLHEHALVDERETVVVRRSAEAVAVGHLDDGHPGRVERAHDRTDLRLGDW